MAGIFIGHRRDDSRHAAGRLVDELALSFGAARIFRDVESIDPGIDLEVALEQALQHGAGMLVVIGPRWLDISNAQGQRRLQQEGDWIRIEVSRAVQRQVRVIPVMLVDTALPDAAALPEMLRPLVRRQALPLSDARWRGDLQRLVETLQRIPGLEISRAPPRRAPRPRHQPARPPHRRRRPCGRAWPWVPAAWCLTACTGATPMACRPLSRRQRPPATSCTHCCRRSSPGS